MCSDRVRCRRLRSRCDGRLGLVSVCHRTAALSSALPGHNVWRDRIGRHAGCRDLGARRLAGTAVGPARQDVIAAQGMTPPAVISSGGSALPPGQAPSGTVTFLFSDVEGSTRLWTADRRGCRRHSPSTTPSCVRRSSPVVATCSRRPAIRSLRRFSRASDAVAAALRAQARTGGGGMAGTDTAGTDRASPRRSRRAGRRLLRVGGEYRGAGRRLPATADRC